MSAIVLSLVNLLRFDVREGFVDGELELNCRLAYFDIDGEGIYLASSKHACRLDKRPFWLNPERNLENHSKSDRRP